MKPGKDWGRFTARGGEVVEAEVRSMVERAGRLVDKSLPSGLYRTMILLGGYGRGEGGIERIDGVERPHNNLDFLMITRPGVRQDPAKLKRRIDDLFRPIVEDHGVGIDTGVVAEWKLRTSPVLVMWFDMRFGHKTVNGDAAFVPSLTRFRKEAIEPADVRDLLVNRGTLLVINDMLLARGARTLADRRYIVKHAMKAIIGYGDAYLFAIGEYDWSYLEKQRRMRASKRAPAALRELYDEAMEFRFEPSYGGYMDRDLGAWMERLRSELAPIHLFFERTRLGDPGLTWETYAEKALRHALIGPPRTLRAFARKGRNLLQTLRAGAPVSGRNALEELAVRCNGFRGNLSVAFPSVLYGEGGAETAELVRRILGARSASPDELRRAYLTQWGTAGDTNFITTVKKLELPLMAVERAV
jgi:hypothetical protein